MSYLWCLVVGHKDPVLDVIRGRIRLRCQRCLRVLPGWEVK